MQLVDVFVWLRCISPHTTLPIRWCFSFNKLLIPVIHHISFALLHVGGIKNVMKAHVPISFHQKHTQRMYAKGRMELQGMRLKT